MEDRSDTKFEAQNNRNQWITEFVNFLRMLASIFSRADGRRSHVCLNSFEDISWVCLILASAFALEWCELRPQTLAGQFRWRVIGG